MRAIDARLRTTLTLLFRRETTIMYCGQCASDQLQKASLVYESGLSFINTTTTGVGGGFGGIGGGVGRTSGTQVSAISAKAAPPRKAKVVGPIVFFFVMLMIALSGSLYFLIIPALTGIFIVRGISYNRSKFPGEYATWDALYMCHRCGAFTKPTFVNPQLVAQAPPSVTTLDHPSLPGDAIAS